MKYRHKSAIQVANNFIQSAKVKGQDVSEEELKKRLNSEFKWTYNPTEMQIVMENVNHH